MDRQLAERMVGAACLLAVLVLVVPSILDGNQESGSTLSEPPTAEVPDLRTHTLSLNDAARLPPVPQPPDMPGEAAVELPNLAPAPAPPPGPPPPSTEAPESKTPAVEPGQAAVVPPETAKPAAVPAAPAASAKTPALADTGQWYVQLGVFSSQQNAEGLAKKLKAGGFSATVRKTSNGAMSRVLVGPRADRKAAVALAGKLKAAGFAGQVTKL
jgi:cell division septation protein DedD